MARDRNQLRREARLKHGDVQTSRHRMMSAIRRHARRLDGCHLAHCRPLESEIRHGFPSLGATGKVIYDTEAAALACARDLLALNQERQVPYECSRVLDGDRHWHLQSAHHVRR